LQSDYTVFQPVSEAALGTRNKDAKGFTIVDAVISLCLIGILIGVVIPRYERVARKAQEVALKTALVNIRTSIKLFKILNGRNPQNLKEMIEKEVMLPARIGSDKYTGAIFFKESYLIEYAVDKEGNIIDAFGNPFIYDAPKGEVRTITKGYETW
jgi:type II secretory pathway pseudopilin PulG